MRSRVLFSIVLSAGAAFAQYIPGSYLVELNGESAVQAPGETRLAARARVQAAQTPMRSRLAAMGVNVRESLSSTLNALIVDIPAGQESQVSFLPGVKRITRAKEIRPLMDAVPAVVNAPAAWRNVPQGENAAGLGIKIGIIDTGIDQTHPAFQDPTLPMPIGFPKADTTANLAFATNKVIVARSYVGMYSSTATDKTPKDSQGHGTAVAMTAAAVKHTAPAGIVSGIAPKAYLGNYKADNPATGGFSSTAIYKAFDDAVADSMDVINMSFGSDLASRLADDPFTDMSANAAARGVIVVVAAGNSGPAGSTVSDFAQSPFVISVGASNNSRTLTGKVTIPDGPTMVAIPSSTSGEATPPVTAKILDITPLDTTSLACNALPAGSLQGRIALILRGTCTFEVKVLNATAAGAIGVIIYTTAGTTPATAALVTATTPTVMVGNADGLQLKQLAGTAGVTGTIDFRLSLATPRDARPITTFSSVGPTMDYAIKPDVVAPGNDIYTALTGGFKGPLDGNYGVVAGTSFSSPITAGAAAFLKGARPGLTVAQYRSLIINSATWMDERLQQRGNGRLNLDSAVHSSIAAVPSSVSYSNSGVNVNARANWTLTNLGTVRDTFQITVFPLTAGPAPTLVSTNQVVLDPGQSQIVQTQFAATGLPGGERNGLFIVKGATTGAQIYVPYWHGVPDNVPVAISVLFAPTSATAGQTTTFYFRLLDSAGMAAIGPIPTVTAGTAGSALVRLDNFDVDSPGVWGATVRQSTSVGTMSYVIQIGSIQAQVNIDSTK